MKTFSKILIVFVMFTAAAAQASDLAKEKRWANQVVDAILDGEAVWLDDGSNKFLGIYTEATDESDHSVIVMHGTGIHPDWQQVVQPLRVGLTEHGWNTLSIQMPVLANDAEYPEYAPLYDEVAPRIDAAIKYLKEHGTKDIVLIGHSQGAAMAAYYLSTSKQKIRGFVAIGMATFADDPRMNSILSLRKIHVPVLDLYGSEDREVVMKSVDDRKASAMQAGNKDYTQLRVTGANHFFDGHEKELVKSVSNWLNR
jgi:pimeloyl-ACP methyl ester carboxylesterase